MAKTINKRCGKRQNFQKVREEIENRNMSVCDTTYDTLDKYFIGTNKIIVFLLIKITNNGVRSHFQVCSQSCSILYNAGGLWSHICICIGQKTNMYLPPTWQHKLVLYQTVPDLFFSQSVFIYHKTCDKDGISCTRKYSKTHKKYGIDISR